MRRKRRSKPIKLNSRFWLRNSQDIKAYREEKLESQKGLCAVTKIPLEVGCLDHTHSDGVGEDGCVRGVLLSEVNMLEGRYLKLFKKLKLDTKYRLTFPEFLISLGLYLQESNEGNVLHFKYMDDFRKHVKRWRKDTLLRKLEEDFNIKADPKSLVSDLVQIYVQAWVDEIEGELNDKETLQETYM